MTPDSVIGRAARALAFGRHIPLTKLARRVELGARRSARDRLPSLAPAPDRALAQRAAGPPLPLFAPRCGQLVVEGATKRFTFLGRTETMTGRGIDWTAPGPAAEQQLWRMNLHYMTYLEEASDTLWTELVSDWIDHNPTNRRGAWRDSWNSYALSIRAIVWMQDLARRRLTQSAIRKAERSLAAQLLFLERNLETDLGGNHLIKNAKALLWASFYFEGADATRWRTTALGILGREISVQVLSDGMHYERSPSYHAEVQADLLECRHVLGPDPLDDPFAGRLDDALHRMAQVTADMAHPDGRAALFNDAGLAMSYAPQDCRDAHARLFGAHPNPRPVFALERAGYFGLRSEESYFVIDCGRIAPDDLVAHGHGDVLSFEWSVAGKRFIVDQGVFEYHAGARRRMSRAATSHNTLSFDSADMADFFGAFRCGRRPDVRVLDYRPTGDGFTLEGTHDGYRHLPGKPRHVRRVEATPRQILLHDRIEGEPDRPASITFLLHPAVRITGTENALKLARDDVAITLAASHPMTVEDAVWWPDMGREQPTKRLRMRLTPGERDATTTLFWKNP